MLDTIKNNLKTEIKTPTTGIIKKSNDKSFFLKFYQESKLADELFGPNPKYNDKSISIIQVVLINKGYMLAECVNL